MPAKKSSKAKEPSPAPASNNKKGPKRAIVKSGNAGNSTKKTDDPSSSSGGSEKQKSIFGDWTGKTPVSLLHEHCQKQGWEKPTFDIAKKKQGFLGTVQLGKRNKKTAQMQTVTLTPPEHFALPTAVEARHLAATFALHRVNSHMPMHRVLPPQHRDYWQEFEKLKTKDNAWQYTPDPFTAQPPTTTAATGRTSNNKLPTKEHQNAAVPMPQQQRAPQMDEKMRKYWESLPAVHMSAENRALVEDVVKKSGIAYAQTGRPLLPEERDRIREGLIHMGFRPSHVEETLDYCSDTATALDWLCLHVPEDDLPSSFMHANYNPTMTTISHTTKSLGRDWQIKKMMSYGYPEGACKEAMQLCDDNDGKALEVLQWRLVHGDEKQQPVHNDGSSIIEELDLQRQEEVAALESIYGSHFKDKSEPDKGTYYFSIELSVQIDNKEQTLILEVMIPKHSLYPHTVPIFTVLCDALPSYLKLSVIKGLVMEAEKNIGMPMVYMCAEWLRENVDSIVAHPPKLRDVTEALVSQTAKKKTRSRPQKSQTKKRPVTEEELKEISKRLKSNLEELAVSEKYRPMHEARIKLPAYQFKQQVLDVVRASQVSIVSGETGCGKTTQVPQFILDDEIMRGRGATCNIICTQPRKVAAISVADRIAAERCEEIGQTVGYAVRGDTKTSSETRLQFVTTGVLLRRLQTDPTLEDVSHVLIDEVHERSVDSDFLLIILRRVIEKRKDLKIVLMSATINQQLFADYFGGAPSVQIPGFTHPVQDYYLEDVISMTSFLSRLPMPKREDKGEKWASWQVKLLEQGYDESTVQTLARYRHHEKIDYDLVAHVVKHILRSEQAKQDEKPLPAILIFMPGAMEIKRCIDAVQAALSSSKNYYEILPLHANLSPQEQTRVFKPVPAEVCKIVVATNVAETSITIDGVAYVIDTGRVKETQYDASSNMLHLVETWASRASCKQRRGRAGRTRPGHCYKLFMRDTEADKMRVQQLPELLRTPLEQLCLQVKAMGEQDVRSFLREAIDSPSLEALDRAIETLQAVEAIDETGSLTPLGQHMASIPADLRVAKMLVLGSIFRCLDAILTIAATMSVKSPFTSPMERREEAARCRQQGFSYGKSDWLTDMKAFDAWQEVMKAKGPRGARSFCEENFLSFTTLTEIASLRRQYADALTDIGFYEPRRRDYYKENSQNVNLVKAVIFGGLNPNLARIRMPDTKYDKVLSGTVEREKEAREIKFYTKDDGRVFLHPSSILFTNNHYTGSYLTYFSKMATSKVFLRDATEIPSYAVLFFGGRVDIDHLGRGLKVGEWVQFRAWARIGVLVNQLKRLLDAELDDKIQDPDVDVAASRVVQVMITLISRDGV